MTNREKLNQMSDEDIGYRLCSLISNVIANVEKKCTAHRSHYVPEACDVCPMASRCGVGKNGFTVWLNEEAQDNA